MKLKELCERLKIDRRSARYLLEQGVIPNVVATGRGNHRELTKHQAICLACACILYKGGFRGRLIPRFIRLLAKEDLPSVAPVQIPLNGAAFVEINLPFICKLLEER